MTRRPCAFRQQDVTRAVRGAKKAGIDLARIEIAQDGKIVLVAENGGTTEEPNDLDRELEEFEARHGKN
ncbi:MAG: hypothetical protein D6773_16215 [Alphaproteobacteria bacterium]|nr:MAG: hypothetical protein D6773_16215 [Alphaproteobacteria bacterium]